MVPLENPPDHRGLILVNGELHALAVCKPCSASCSSAAAAAQIREAVEGRATTPLREPERRAGGVA